MLGSRGPSGRKANIDLNKFFFFQPKGLPLTGVKSDKISKKINWRNKLGRELKKRTIDSKLMQTERVPCHFFYFLSFTLPQPLFFFFFFFNPGFGRAIDCTHYPPTLGRGRSWLFDKKPSGEKLGHGALRFSLHCLL